FPGNVGGGGLAYPIATSAGEGIAWPGMRLGCGQRAARQVVELHGGEIVASSDGPGRGARFSLCLPLTPDAAGDPAPRGTAAAVDRDAAAEQLAGRRVLVVEDDADARKLLCELLRMHGAEVHGAGSATQALGLLDAIDADILVSDIGMPGRDGHWLIAEV